MSTKPNIRSFRYSDEVAEILMNFEGENMNAKFENLVLFCHKQLPAKKKELKQAQEQIDAKWARYRKLCAKLGDLNQLTMTVERLIDYGRNAETQLTNLIADNNGVPKNM